MRMVILFTRELTWRCRCRRLLLLFVMLLFTTPVMYLLSMSLSNMLLRLLVCRKFMSAPVWWVCVLMIWTSRSLNPLVISRVHICRLGSVCPFVRRSMLLALLLLRVRSCWSVLLRVRLRLRCLVLLLNLLVPRRLWGRDVSLRLLSLALGSVWIRSSSLLVRWMLRLLGAMYLNLIFFRC